MPLVNLYLSQLFLSAATTPARAYKVEYLNCRNGAQGENRSRKGKPRMLPWAPERRRPAARPSVAAFYLLPGCLFYRVRCFRCGGFIIVFMQPSVLCEVKKIVDRVSQILFAAEIAFCRLNRCVAQQELYLLQFTAAIVAEFRAGPPQIVRCNVLQACSLAAGSDHVPYNVLRDAVAPHLSPSGDRSKDFALKNPSGSGPLIESGFHPA